MMECYVKIKNFSNYQYALKRPVHFLIQGKLNSPQFHMLLQETLKNMHQIGLSASHLKALQAKCKQLKA